MVDQNTAIKYAVIGTALLATGYLIYKRLSPDAETVQQERNLLIEIADVLMQSSDRAKTNFIPLSRKDIDNNIFLITKQYNKQHNTQFKPTFSVNGPKHNSAMKVVTLKGRYCKQEVSVYCN